MADESLPPIVSRSQAKEAGLKRFFTGVPCNKRGHISERRTSNGDCVQCVSEMQAVYYAKPENMQRKRDYDKARSKEADVQADRSFYVAHNQDRIRAARAQWSSDPANQEKIRGYSADYRGRLTPEERRVNRLRSVYRLTQAGFGSMLAAQSGLCKICDIALATLPPNYTHVDHDHSTGVVRGILCRHCNTGLGQFRDDIAVLQSAVRYLDAALTKKTLPNN